MNDLRTQLPECPLAYEVPHIPVTHTALVIVINAADIDWQAKMLPWTLASLINNTDLIMNGVHLYIACENGTENRIKTALKRFELPKKTIIEVMRNTDLHSRYDIVCDFNINLWAFRDESNTYKLDLDFSEIQTPGVSYPPISEVSPAPMLYNMEHCTTEQFRHAIKQLMGAQLAMKV